MAEALNELERQRLTDIENVEAAGASLIRTAAGRWAVRDRDGAYVVRNAMSIAEAARLFGEDQAQGA